MKKYDLIVIGSGAGNIVLDAAIEKGKHCALIESNKFGGTCLTRGCLPTKVMVTVANEIMRSKHWSKLGLIAPAPQLDWEKFSARVWNKINETDSVRRYYDKRGADTYHGTARFISSHELEVSLNDSTEIVEMTGTDIVIAAGARTRIPDLEGIDDVDYITSESFFGEDWPDKLYKSLIIVGGGPIGCEFAHVFSAFGTEVTLVGHNPYLAPKGDRAQSEALAQSFQKRGIELHLNKEPFAISQNGNSKSLSFRDRDTQEITTVTAENILIAPGIRPNTDRINAQAAGVSLDKRGYIMSNECMETGIDGLYTLGDINGRYALRHKANYEAEILAYNLYLREQDAPYRRASYKYTPAVTYTWPELASVGLSEEQCKRDQLDIRVGKMPYSHTGKGYAMGYDSSSKGEAFVKMIVDRSTNRIIGFHACGDEASLLMAGYVYLMQNSPHEIPVLNPELKASEACKAARLLGSKDIEVITPDNIMSIERSMTAHPSLSEVAAWVTEYLD